MVELGKADLDEDAIPFVLEELETGQQPYLLAAAARALRRAKTRSPAFAPILLRSIETLARRDDLVDLSTWGGAAQFENSGSALTEALFTLRWLAPHAHGIRTRLQELADGSACPLTDDHRQTIREVLREMEVRGSANGTRCCDLPLTWRKRTVLGRPETLISTVRFEDQHGLSVSWEDYFVGQPSIVAFFYTRCDNEEKCSLTVNKLAQVQRLLESVDERKSVHLAAITYDPEFDLPDRLRGYAESRSLVPKDNCRLLRTMQGREILRDYFGSGVNFVGPIVNRHRIEVFVLDALGRIRVTYVRLSWNPNDLVNEIRSMPKEAGQIVKGTDGSGGTAIAGMAPSLWALLLAMLPKCPICGATYLSGTGLVALPYLPGWEKAWPAILLLLIVNLTALAWLARSRKKWSTLSWSLTGAAMLIGPGLSFGYVTAMNFGAALILIGSIAEALLRKHAWHERMMRRMRTGRF